LPYKSRLDALVTNPDLAPVLSLLKGIRNGAVYGAKVRFPHALVYVLRDDGPDATGIELR
jgi:hypothetical protein